MRRGTRCTSCVVTPAAGRGSEDNGTFTIHRLPALSPVFGGLHDVVNFPYPVSPVWLRAIDRVVRRSGAEMILVRDIPLALPAIAVGRLRRIPVVLDMAENYPAMLEDQLRYTPTRMVDRLIRQPGLAKLIERASVRLMNSYRRRGGVS